jgi:hypothetical protein
MKHFGITIRRHADLGNMWIFVDAGPDPVDGLPGQFAKPATPWEIRLWEQRRFTELAEMLAAQGLPVQLPAAKRRRQRRRY